MKERRTKPRYNAMFPCTFSALESENRAIGTIVNISEHGVAIEAPEAPSEGRDIAVSFRDNWGKEIRFYGRVIHTNPGVSQEDTKRFGVQITFLTEGLSSLNGLISELADPESSPDDDTLVGDN